MGQLQSIAILLGLVALAFAPVAFVIARRLDHKQEEILDDILPLEVGVARHMYSKAVGDDPTAMHDYDQSPALQAMWQAEAGYKLAGR